MKGADLGPDASGRPYSSLVLRRLLTQCWARLTGAATLLMGCTTASLADCSDRPRDRPDLDAAGVGRYGTRSPAGGHPGRSPAPRCSDACRAVARRFFLPFAGYLSVAVLLDLVYHSVVGDATSREANAYYVFFSNDPHLAAIGFVWNPLTSLTEMPLILLKGLWPALTTEAFASGIMSSVFMAATCYQLFRFMEELGVRRTVRWLLVAAFAVNPMIVFSGGNGMSEALFLFTLVATTRYLARWLVGARTRDLIVAGIWLGLAYADRNEAAMAALVSSLVVLIVSYRRSVGSVYQRRLVALTDAVLFAAPFALSFLGWATVSWIIVGHPFEQFSSVYGTSSQLQILNAGQAGRTQAYTLQAALGVILAFAPLIPLAALGAVGRAWHERDPRIFAILSVLGGVLMFEVVAFRLHAINIAERYFIYAVPVMVLFAALIARPVAKSAAELREERQEKQQGWTPRYLAARRRQRRALTLAGAIARSPYWCLACSPRITRCSTR